MKKNKKKVRLFNELKKNKGLFVMLMPAILLTLLFAYIPMVGLVLAFKDYRYDLGIFKSQWIGLENFKFFFMSGTGVKITINTILYNFINLITSQALSVLVAISITEMNRKYFKKIVQSIIFLPYFISWIIVGAFIYNIFNVEYGTLNNILEFFGHNPVNLYQMPYAWVLIIIFFNSWKWVGYNSIIYISAITGIDQSTYEAAKIDGANIWQRISKITIPSIKSTIIIILLLNIGRITRGDFQMFYQIVGNNGQLFNATDVIDTFVFRALAQGGDIGMITAATLYQSIIGFILIATINYIVKKIEPDYALY
ncbi:MAG: ABC transporter permease subunit [Lachnospirales bacterium]